MTTSAIHARPAQSLLAYLLLNPVAHRRERLAGLLWPDSTEANARRNLRQALPLGLCGNPFLLAGKAINLGLDASLGLLDARRRGSGRAAGPRRSTRVDGYRSWVGASASPMLRARSEIQIST